MRQNADQNDFEWKTFYTVLSLIDDEKMQSIDRMGRYECGTSKDLEIEKEVIKCNNVIRQKWLILMVL